MDVFRCIGSRQSCRRFSAEAVDRRLIDQCLDAARLAPSACNSQPWRFIIIDSEPLRSEVAAAAFSGLYAMNKFAGGAPVLLALIREQSVYYARLGGSFRGLQYSLIDIGIAGAHFDLAAAALGLGMCWLGWFNERAVKKLLGLGKRERLEIMLALGYPEQSGLRPKKRKSLEEIRSYFP